MFRKKVVAEPTLADRVATATVTADMHLSAFEDAAKGLEDTADELDKVRDAAAEAAASNTFIKINADQAAFAHRAKAQKIRDLIS